MNTLLSSRRTISNLRLLTCILLMWSTNTWISNVHLLWDYTVISILALVRIDDAQRYILLTSVFYFTHLHRYMTIIHVVLLFRAILVITTAAIFPRITYFISFEIGSTMIRITWYVLRAHFQTLSLTFNFPGGFTSFIILFVNCRPIFLQLSTSLNMIQ